VIREENVKFVKSGHITIAKSVSAPYVAALFSRHASRLTFHISLILCCVSAFASHAAIDESKLPPAASLKVDFERDIKPILETTCWRCHGPERPKSHFRLDNRESALKGGENGVDILPGNSAGSPLIHYVARLVPDFEMPPPGKGQPLAPEQIGLLRAWIDQGAQWGATNPPVQLAFSAATTLRWISVQGDKSKFREIEGMKEGFGGGLEHFSMQEKIGPDKTFSAEGRALFPDNDFQIKLALQKADVGFVRGGFEQWRRYYDDTGGYYQPFAVPSFNLNRDLHLDIGRAWIDFGLTLPAWPQIVVGYEYQFKEGSKSMLAWGPVGGETNAFGRNIYPSAKDIDEQVHIVKFDLSHEFGGWRVEDSARVEFYRQKTQQADARDFMSTGGPDVFVQTREGASHVQGMNTIRLERQITDCWFLSGGYLYSRFDGDASFNQQTLTSDGVPTIGQFWSSDVIVLKREAHDFSLATLLQPVEGLSGSLGVQAEWQRQHGAGNISLNPDPIDPTVPASFVLNPATIHSDLDESKVMENAGLRFTKIPFTVLFGEARFEQDNIGQIEEDDIVTRPASAFLRDTDARNDQRDGRVGFNTSPWPWISFSAHYKNRLSSTDYDKRVDFKILDPMNHVFGPNPGYSAFIRNRKMDTDEVEAKLVLHPVNWLRAALTYQLVSTEYSTTTDPVPGGIMPESLLAGNYDAHVYGLGLTLTPFQRLYFSGTFTYSESRIVTGLRGEPSIAPYEGHLYSVMASANFSLNSKTDLHCAYSFSQADYGQSNAADGLPLGLTYSRHGLMAGVSRRLTSYLTSTLRYGFYRYSEPSTGGNNDYTAHGIFATLLVKWP